MEQGRRGVLRGLAISPILLIGLTELGCTKLANLPGETGFLDQFKPSVRLMVSIGVDRILVGYPELSLQVVQVCKVVRDGLDGGKFKSGVEAVQTLLKLLPLDLTDSSAQTLVNQIVLAVGEQFNSLANKYEITQSVQLGLVRELISWVESVALNHRLDGTMDERKILAIPRKERKGN